jgi:hypothetical protein
MGLELYERERETMRNKRGLLLGGQKTRGLQCGETSSPDDHPMDPDEAWKTAGLLRRELFGFPVPTPRDLPTPTYDWD